jgi:hypothetical protein
VAKLVAIGAALTWPFLLPGNLACDAMGIGTTEYRDLIRMLINSLVWTAVGVAVIALTV